MSLGGLEDPETAKTSLPAPGSAPDVHNSPSVPLPRVLSGPLEPESVVRWNTTNIGLQLGANALSAATASALVAPIICVIDRSIVEKAATGTSFSSCFRRSIRPALTRPHLFVASKPFLLVLFLYFSTYMTANSIDTLTTMVKSKPASTVTSGPVKFVATSAVNMSVCVYKDSCFAKLFGGGSSSAASKIPRLSYLLFATRDSMTIFASFNLPPLIAARLAGLPPAAQEKFSRLLSTENRRSNTAQFITPAAMQIFSTPIHLLGLDLFNRQGKLGFSERFARISRDWGVSAFARMGRIIPAFGVGGVVNANMRKKFMTTLGS